MVKDFLNGKMDHHMKEIMKMIKNTDLENMLTNKVKVFRDNGRMVFETEKESLQTKAGKFLKEDGRTAISFDIMHFSFMFI